MTTSWRQFFSNRYKSDNPCHIKAGYGNILSLKLRKRVIKKIIHKFYISGICVDIGCGLGAYCDVLPSNYIGVDSVFEALCLLSRSYNKYVCVGDAENLPIRDETSDLSISIETAQYIRSFDLSFYEISRITRHGGIFIMIAPNPDSIQWILWQKMKGKSPLNFIKLSSTVDMLKNYGFSVLKIDGIFAPLIPLDYLNGILNIQLPYNFIKTFSKSFVVVAQKR